MNSYQRLKNVADKARKLLDEGESSPWDFYIELLSPVDLDDGSTVNVLVSPGVAIELLDDRLTSTDIESFVYEVCGSMEAEFSYDEDGYCFEPGLLRVRVDGVPSMNLLRTLRDEVRISLPGEELSKRIIINTQRWC